MQPKKSIKTTLIKALPFFCEVPRWLTITAGATYKSAILKRGAKGLFLAGKQGFHGKFSTLFFVFFRFIGIVCIASPCVSTISVDPILPKKSGLKTYGRFFVFSRL